MKNLLPFLVIYVLIQDGSRTIKASWSDGQPVAQLMIERQKTNPGLTFEIVNQKQFDSTIVALPVPTTDPIKEQAISDAKNTALDSQTRLNALIKAIDLK